MFFHKNVVGLHLLERNEDVLRKAPREGGWEGAREDMEGGREDARGGWDGRRRGKKR